MLQRYSMSFDGHLLERGFWLYVWRIVSPQGVFLYVGRTGDSSSPHAGSPFSRIGQHLDFRPYAKGNALGRRLAAAGVRPAECLFEMLAVGPIFPEQTTWRRTVRSVTERPRSRRHLRSSSSSETIRFWALTTASTSPTRRYLTR